MKCCSMAVGYTALLLADFAAAVRLTASARRRSPLGRPSFSRRETISGFVLTDNADLEYLVNITLSGQPFNVIIDTGRYFNLTSSPLHRLIINLVPICGFVDPSRTLLTWVSTPLSDTPSALLPVCRIQSIYFTSTF